MTDNKTGVKVEILPLTLQALHVTIEGTAPIIFSRWTEKAMQMILDKQMKKAKTARAARNPDEEYEASFYRNKNGVRCFPAICIKRALTDSARFVDGLKMTLLRGALFVKGDTEDNQGLQMISIENGNYTKRMDYVRLPSIGSPADLRFRGQADKGWRMSFVIEYNTSIFTKEQIVNLLSIAGTANGLGEWRPERGGEFGTFKILAGASTSESSSKTE